MPTVSGLIAALQRSIGAKACFVITVVGAFELGGLPHDSAVEAGTWIEFSGSASGNFTDTNHWSGGAPGSGTAVTIDLNPASGYTVVLDQSSTIGSLVLNSQLLTMSMVSRTLTVNGASSMNGGTVTMNGARWIAASMQFGGMSSVNFFTSSQLWAGSQFQNSGSLNLGGTGRATIVTLAGSSASNLGDIGSAAGVDFEGFVQFNNSGTITASTASITLSGRGLATGGPASSFINSGTITAGLGLGLIGIDSASNTGTIIINGGGSGYSSGGTFVNSGRIALASGRTFGVSNGSTLEVTGAGNITGSGLLSMESATLKVSGSFTPGVANWQLRGVKVVGGGAVTNATSLVLDGSLSGTANAFNSSFTNSGTVTLTGTRNDFLGDWTNESTGVFTIGVGTPHSGFTASNGLTNRGTLNFAVGSGAGDIVTGNNTVLNEGSGTINVNSGAGSIDLVGGGTFQNQGIVNISSSLHVTGASQFVNSGTINAGGGGLDADALTDFNNSGTMNATGAGGIVIEAKAGVNSGTLASTNSPLSINGRGLAQGFAAATFNNSGTIAAGGVLTISGVDEVSNGGTIGVTGGNFELVGGATLVNTGTIAMASGRVFTVRAGGTLEVSGAGNISGSGKLMLERATLKANGGFTPAIANWELLSSTVTGGGAINNATTLVMNGNQSSTQNFVYTNFANTGTATVNGPFNNFHGSLTNEASGTLVIGTGTPNSGFTASNGLTNRGVLTFAVGNGSGDIVTGDNTVLNEGSGTINVSSGAGSIDLVGGGTFQNQGIVNISSSLHVTGASQFVNSGTINAGGGGLDADALTDFNNSGTMNATGAGGIVIEAKAGVNSGTLASTNSPLSINGRGLAQGFAAATFNNSGTIAAGGALTISGVDEVSNGGTIGVTGGSFELVGGATLVNTGTIAMASGRVFTVRQGGTLEVSGAGNVTGSGKLTLERATLKVNGSFTPGIANWELAGATVTGGGSLANATSLVLNGALTATPNLVKVGFVNSGTVTVNATANGFQSGLTNETSGVFTIGSGSPNSGFTLSGGLTNRGTLNFAVGSGIGDIVAGTGTILNEASGTIGVVSGSGAIDGLLDNRGTINVTGGNLTFSRNGAVHTNSGSINVATSRTVTFDKFTTFNNGGTITSSAGGVIALNPSSFADVTLNNTGTINAGGGLSSSVTTLSNGGTISISGGDFNLNNNGILFNTGTVVLETGRSLQVNAGAKLISSGSGQVLGVVDGQGVLKVNASGTLTINNALEAKLGNLEINRGRIDGGGSLINSGVMNVLSSVTQSAARVGVGLTNQGSVIVRDQFNFFDSTVVNEATGTMTLRGSSSTNQLTLTNGMTNRGVFELTADAAVTASLVSTTGTIINEAGGRIEVLGGAGGTRSISGNLDNRGDLNVSRSLSLVRSSGTYANSGTITVSNGQAFNATGFGSFDNSGQISATTGGLLTFQGISSSTATFVNSGTISAGAGMSVSTLTAFTNSGTVTVSGGNFTINNRLINTGTIAMAAGRTLSVSSTTMEVNGGYVVGTTPGAGLFSISTSTLNVSSEFQPTIGQWDIVNTRVQGAGSITNPTTLNLIGTSFSTPNRFLSTLRNTGTINIRGDDNFFDAPVINESTGRITLRATAVEFDAAATISSAGSLTNRGILELTSDNGGAATLNVNGGFINEAGGRFDILPGAGGNRFVNAHLDNRGDLNVYRSLSMSKSSALFTNSGVVTLSPGVSLTISGPSTFTNSGTISGTSAGLLAITGASFSTAPFVNSGTIFAGGGLTLGTFTTALNSGTITVSSGNFAVSNIGLFTNNGTIAVGAGRTFSVTSMTVTMGTAGVVQGLTPGVGAMSLVSSTLNVTGPFAPEVAQWDLTNTRVQGAGSITNSSTLNVIGTFSSQPTRFVVSLRNTGTVNIRGDDNFFDAPVINESTGRITLRATSSEFDAVATISSAGSLTNRGILELTSDNGGNSTLNVNGGFINEAGARLDVLPGAGGARSLNAHLDNRGALNVARSLSMSKSLALFTNSGIITLSPGVSLTISGPSTFTNSSSGVIGGTSSGFIAISGASSLTTPFSNAGAIISGGGMSLSTFTTADNSGTITVSGGNFTVNSVSVFANSGTIAMAAGRTFSVSSMTLNIASGGTVRGVNSGEGAFLMSSSSRLIVADEFNPDLAAWEIQNSRVVTAGAGALKNSTTLTLLGQFFSNPTRIQVPMTNEGVLTTLDDEVYFDSTTLNQGGARLTVRGTAANGNAVLTLAGSLTNNGVVELISDNASNASLTVNGAVLQNNTGARIDVMSGGGGARTIQANIDNFGEINVYRALTLNKASATYTNRGTITVTGGATLNVASFGRFENQNFLNGETAGTMTLSGISSATSTVINSGIISAGAGLHASAIVTFSNHNDVGVGPAGVLSVTAGTLFNGPQGEIYVSNGTGTGGIFAALLVNQGYLEVNRNFIVDKTGVTSHTNSGEIVVASGALLDFKQFLTVNGAAASVTLTGAGRLSNTVGFIGSEVGTKGSVTVGDGSIWTNNGSLLVSGTANAAGGTANILIESGGRLDVTGVIRLWTGGTITVQPGGILNVGTIDMRGGTLNNDGSFTGTNLALSGGQYTGNIASLPNTISNNAELVFSQQTTGTYSGVISGSGSVSIDGGAVLTISSQNTYTGATQILGGTLAVVADVVAGTNGALGNATSDVGLGRATGAGGAALFVGHDVDFGRVIAVSGDGTSTRTIGVTGTGTGRFHSQIKLHTTAQTLLQVGAGGTLVADGGISGTGGLTIVGGGTVRLDGPLSYSGNTLVADGTLDLGADVDSPLIQVAGGATLDVRRLPQLIVADRHFVNNGAVLGAVHLGDGAVGGGSGSFEHLIVNDGSTYSPGNSPGSTTDASTTWNGGTYLWEINRLAGFGGTEGANPGWDLWNTGVLAINGPYTISVNSLTADDLAGALADWNPASGYSWRIATSTNGAFSSLSNLSLTTSGFTAYNSLQGGTFSLGSGGGGNDLYLHYTAVPEPSSFALAALVASGYAAWKRRRARRAVPATVDVARLP